jgi:phosphotransferase system  glucose/maltose/N-acetylglucosamine-specific IIC component
MWTTFFNNFTLALMAAGFSSLLFTRRPFAVRALLVLMIALASSTPDLVLGYFPKLHDGWMRYVAGILIVLVIAWPFSFWMERLNRKSKREASAQRDQSGTTSGE